MDISEFVNVSSFGKEGLEFFIHFTYSDNVCVISYCGFVKNELLDNINVELSFNSFKED